VVGLFSQLHRVAIVVGGGRWAVVRRLVWGETVEGTSLPAAGCGEWGGGLRLCAAVQVQAGLH